jgi:ATP-dependent exoDNAse (exonuclease V) beta subunit
VVPFALTDETHAQPYRELEAATLARYIRSLIEGEHLVTDPYDEESRPLRLGDIAVLTLATPTLRFLARELDRARLPYTISGGRLFLEDPLHQQFMLGLRALADRDDGVALAALLRPPFFAIDLDDLLHERAGVDGTGRERLEEARRIVQTLRRTRFDRSPGATARALLEETAFGRVAALGPNGEQRLANLRELCLMLDEIALNEGRDYDGATAKMRSWLAFAPQLQAARPVDSDAVQLMTVHQAKGLEFPVVVLWDGMAQLKGISSKPPWRVDRTSARWAIHLDGLTHSEPPESDLAAAEKAYLDHERRRLIYVACTRARDLLVLPRPAAANDRHVAKLLCEYAGPCVHTAEPHSPQRPADWYAKVAQEELAPPRVAADLEAEVDAAWYAALESGSAADLAPTWVTELAAPAVGEAGEVMERAGRFGATFGTVVHAALELLLLDPDMTVPEAVARVSRAIGATERLDEARADIERVLAALREQRLLTPEGPSLRVEYPARLTIIDFKTDHPPRPWEAVPARYANQVRVYARLLAQANLIGGREVRCGLLYTADGVIRWINPHLGAAVTGARGGGLVP